MKPLQEEPGKAHAWKSLSTGLPQERDFDPDQGDLDALYAWKQFGGATLDQAFARFLSDPGNRQEDFMFMGPKAFLYYFPVLERYLHSAQAESSPNDMPLWILGHAFLNQLQNKTLTRNPALIERLTALTLFVCANPDRFDPSPVEQVRILEPWIELRNLLAKLSR